MSVAPVIETERLRLRGHRVEDYAALCAMWADPKVTQFIGNAISPPDQVWARLMRYAGHWPLLGFGYWALEEKTSGKFIGDLGFAEAKRDMFPSIHGFPELGWALCSEWHGKGYAFEAVSAAIKWGDTHLSEKRTVCIISPDNLKSIRLAEKCGYKQVVETTYASKPTLLFERINSN
jgi:RimJ/RimL family protein N-acetyltransferase